MTTANLTIQDNDTVIQYTATAAQTVFPYDFPILDEDELNVSVDQVDKTISVDYTVDGVGDAGGGNVTFGTAMAGGEIVTIWLDMPIKRLTGFATGAATLLGTDLNTELARQVRHDQMLRREIRAALRLAPDDVQGGQDMELPTQATRAGKVLGFAADGTPTMLSVSETGDDTSLRADLAASDSDKGTTLITQQGFYTAQYAHTLSQLREGEPVSLWSFIPDSAHAAIRDRSSTTAMQTYLQAAIDAIADERNGGSLYVPAGLYYLEDRVTIPECAIDIYGEGAGGEGLFKDDGSGYATSGSTLRLASSVYTASSRGIVRIRYEGSVDDSRTCARLRNLVIDGNRGAPANPTDGAALARNTYGIGVEVEGSRFVELNGLFVMRCAEVGVKAVSGGTQSDTTNELSVVTCHLLANGSHGASLSGGDSMWLNVNAGFNGGNGFVLNGGKHATGIRAWDNFTHGIVISNDDIQVSCSAAFDNQSNGLVLSGAVKRVMVDIVCQDNGKDTGIAATQRCNVRVGDAVAGCSIRAIVGNKDESASTGAQYGIFVADADAVLDYDVIGSGTAHGVALISDATKMAAGSGIEGVAEVYQVAVESAAGKTPQPIITTRILIDLTGLNSSAAADIIGDNGIANCHIGQYLAARSGTLLGGQMTCLEAPATGEDDIDLYAADEATGQEDTAITALTNDAALLTKGSAWAVGDRLPLTALPADEQYLYLVGGGSGADATYTAGRFLIEFWGTP